MSLSARAVASSTRQSDPSSLRRTGHVVPEQTCDPIPARAGLADGHIAVRAFPRNVGHRSKVCAVVLLSFPSGKVAVWAMRHMDSFVSMTAVVDGIPSDGQWFLAQAGGASAVASGGEGTDI